MNLSGYALWVKGSTSPHISHSFVAKRRRVLPGRVELVVRR